MCILDLKFIVKYITSCVKSHYETLRAYKAILGVDQIIEYLVDRILNINSILPGRHVFCIHINETN